MFQTEVVEEIKTQFMSNNVLLKIMPFIC